MTRPGVPESLDSVSAKWFSDALGETYPGVAVTDIERSTVIHGTATKAKFDLTYNAAGRDAGLPATLWLKSPFESFTGVFSPSGIYLAEPRFYGELRPQLAVNAPISYYAAANHERGVGVVLLEDLYVRGATLGYVTRPASVDQVAATLEELARLHAHWWRSPVLDTVFPVRPPPPAGQQSPFTRLQEADGCEELLADPRADGVPRELCDPERMSRALKIWQAMSSERICMIHGDSHYGNVFYDADGKSGHFDWQNYRCGHWCHDVSYFMGSALRVRDREHADKALVAHYVEALKGFGVDEVSFDHAWLKYRQFLMYGYWIFLANWELMQPFEVNSTYVTRFAAAVRDHDTYRLLEEA